MGAGTGWQGSSDRSGATYWGAAAVRPAPDLAPLRGDADCEVAVIGGGFTGLSAAHHLAEAGVDVALVEAGRLGRGASGRTAGMAGTRYKRGWASLARAYGSDETLRLHAALGEARTTLLRLVRDYGAEDALHAGGQLVPAHTPEALAALERDLEWLAREAGEREAKILGRAETERESGSHGYCGAWLDPRGGAVQPVELLHAVATGLLARGCRLYGESPVLALQQQAEGLTLTTPQGRLRARQVVLATNAYTPPGLVQPDPAKRLVPVASSILVTASLPEEVARSILPYGRVASDTRRLLQAYRMLPGNRLLYGGRADITGRRAEDPRSYAALERSLAGCFPQIARPEIDWRWSGLVGVTRDGFPHVGRLGPRLVYALGYGGRGVVLSQLLGRLAAELAGGATIEPGPMGAAGFRRWPFHGLRIPAMQAAAWIYQHRDRRDLIRAARP